MDKKESNDILINEICELVSNGSSLNAALKTNDKFPNRQAFYRLIESNDEYLDKYARATQYRADLFFENMIAISSTEQVTTSTVDDGFKITTTRQDNTISRRLQVDTLKWAIARMHPKKYGDKMEVDHKNDGGKFNIINLGSGVKPDESI